MKERTTSHVLGPVTLAVSGTHPLADQIRKEAGFRTRNDRAPDLHIHVQKFAEVRFKETYNCGDNFVFNNTDIRVEENGYTYWTENLFSGETTHLYVRFHLQRNGVKKALDVARRSLSPTFDSHQERVKTRFMSYTTLWPIAHLELLSHDASFIHASVVDHGGKGTLIAGTGGSGKTSTGFQFLENDDYRYLSEDFGIVTSSGKSMYSPRFATIYHSDYIHGQSDLVEYVDEHLGGLDKLHWRLLVRRGGDPRRKVPPDQILDPYRIAERTDLSRAVFIRRTNTSDVVGEEIETREFVNRSIWASFRELKRLYNLLCQAEAVGAGETAFPSITDVMDETRRLYMGCFDDVDTYRLDIPFDAPPTDVVAVIDSL